MEKDNRKIEQEKQQANQKKEKEKETLNLWHVYLHLRKITEIETQ